MIHSIHLNFNSQIILCHFASLTHSVFFLELKLFFRLFYLVSKKVKDQGAIRPQNINRCPSK